MSGIEVGLFVLVAGFVINIIFAEKKPETDDIKLIVPVKSLNQATRQKKHAKALAKKNKLYKLYKPLGGRK